jgi:hypothetical protein
VQVGRGVTGEAGVLAGHVPRAEQPGQARDAPGLGSLLVIAVHKPDERDVYLGIAEAGAFPVENGAYLAVREENVARPRVAPVDAGRVRPARPVVAQPPLGGANIG